MAAVPWYQDQGLAAWVQAIGSILAIGAAIAIAYAQEWFRKRDEKADRALRARAIGANVSLELVRLLGEIEEAQRAPNSAITGVVIPDTITDYIDDYWIMGKAGDHLILLVSVLRAHNVRIDANQRNDSMNYGAEDVRAEMNRAGAERLRHAHDDCVNAIAEVGKLIKAPLAD